MKTRSRQQASFFYSKLFLTLCVGLVALLSIAVAGEYNRQAKVSLKITELTKEATKLEQSNFELAKLVNYLKSDDYVELEARHSLGYKKPGEKVVVVKGVSDYLLNHDNQDGQKTSNPKKWLIHFFK